MKPILLALTVTASSAAAAHAAVFTTPPVALDSTSELVVSVANSCAAEATYDIVVKNAINGQNLRRKRGTLASSRGTVLPYSFGATNPGALVYHQITFECVDGSQAKPLIIFTVRDLQTNVPRFSGSASEDAGI